MQSKFKFIKPFVNVTVVNSFVQTANGKEIYFIEDSFGERVSDYFENRWDAIVHNSTPNFNV